MVVTSSLFGLIHLSMQPTIIEFLMYAALGALMYHCFARRGNLKHAILLHIFNNMPIALVLGIQALNN